MNKKILDDVLSVNRRIATSSNESIKGRPVPFNKAGQRFPRRFIRIGLARLQDNGPMRRLKRRSAFLQRTRNRFRRSLTLTDGGPVCQRKMQTLTAKLDGPTVLGRRWQSGCCEHLCQLDKGRPFRVPRSASTHPSYRTVSPQGFPPAASGRSTVTPVIKACWSHSIIRGLSDFRFERIVGLIPKG